MRKAMREGGNDLISFDEIYRATDGSKFDHLPVFGAGSRIHACQVFLSMEQEMLEQR